ncbi:hypothetical protein CRENBAI_003903 [Crenichthys baileyi]|uniref:Uncharacterized protein n=1 Tax=Crenichthys baileyi TaxID=28760 RepID=A0AAV9QYN8_9TELE
MQQISTPGGFTFQPSGPKGSAADWLEAVTTGDLQRSRGDHNEMDQLAKCRGFFFSMNRFSSIVYQQKQCVGSKQKPLSEKLMCRQILCWKTADSNSRPAYLSSQQLLVSDSKSEACRGDRRPVDPGAKAELIYWLMSPGDLSGVQKLSKLATITFFQGTLSNYAHTCPLAAHPAGFTDVLKKFL